MSNRSADDDNGAEGSLAHNAGWSDVWAGLFLTLVLLGSAILLAIFLSGRTSGLSSEDRLAATEAKYLLGVRDLSRPGWRTADRPWNLMGVHERTSVDEDRDRQEMAEEGGPQEAAVETSVADLWRARRRESRDRIVDSYTD